MLPYKLGSPTTYKWSYGAPRSRSINSQLPIFKAPKELAILFPKKKPHLSHGCLATRRLVVLFYCLGRIFSAPKAVTQLGSKKNVPKLSCIMWVPSLHQMMCICPPKQAFFNGISQTRRLPQVERQAPVLSPIAAPPFKTGFLCRTPCELKKLAYCLSIGLARMSPSTPKLLQMSHAKSPKSACVSVLSMPNN